MRQLIKQELRSFILQNFLFGRDQVLRDDDSFLEKGIIDSTGILELVSYVEERYDITVESDELVPDNLDSVTRLVGFISEKLDTKAVSRPAECAGTHKLSTNAK
jgi:acyl carrier protein